jgi:hypothetical protein
MVLLKRKQPNFKWKLSFLNAAHKAEEGSINDLISFQNLPYLVNQNSQTISRPVPGRRLAPSLRAALRRPVNPNTSGSPSLAKANQMVA